MILEAVVNLVLKPTGEALLDNICWADNNINNTADFIVVFNVGFESLHGSKQAFSSLHLLVNLNFKLDLNWTPDWHFCSEAIFFLQCPLILLQSKTPCANFPLERNPKKHWDTNTTLFTFFYAQFWCLEPFWKRMNPHKIILWTQCVRVWHTLPPLKSANCSSCLLLGPPLNLNTAWCTRCVCSRSDWLMLSDLSGEATVLWMLYGLHWQRCQLDAEGLGWPIRR